MTESEALKYMILFRDEWDRNSKTKNAMALDVAIKALQEMQKIKELGDCYIIPKNGVWEINGVDIHKAIEEIQQYRAIGTVEEIKELHDAVHCNAFTDGYKKGSMSMLKEFNRKIDELENLCKETYGCEIIEMYVEIVLKLKKWLKHLNN